MCFQLITCKCFVPRLNVRILQLDRNEHITIIIIIVSLWYENKLLLKCIKNESNQRAHTCAKVNLVWIWSPYPTLHPDDFQNLMDTSLSKLHLLYHEDLISVSRGMSQTWNIPVSRSVSGKLPKFNKFSLSKATSVIKVSSNSFSSFYTKLLTERQTDRQRDKETHSRYYITSLAEVTCNNVRWDASHDSCLMMMLMRWNETRHFMEWNKTLHHAVCSGPNKTLLKLLQCYQPKQNTNN